MDGLAMNSFLRSETPVKLLALVTLLLGVLVAPVPAQAVTDPLTGGYSHIAELDFHPKPDYRPTFAKKYPVLRTVEPCEAFMPHVFPRYGSHVVLVCW